MPHGLYENHCVKVPFCDETLLRDNLGISKEVPHW